MILGMGKSFLFSKAPWLAQGPNQPSIPSGCYPSAKSAGKWSSELICI